MIFKLITNVTLPLSLLIISCSSFFAFSATTKIKDLDFGKVAISGNTQVSRITLSRFGQFSVTNDIYVIEAGSPGEVEISGYLPGTTLFLSGAPVSPFLSATGIPTSFNFISVDVAPSVFIGNTGTATISIGGVVETTGDSSTYFDSNYTNAVQVTISF